MSIGYIVSSMVKREAVLTVRVEDWIYERVKELVSESEDLGVTQSELIHVILKAYLVGNPSPEDMKQIRSLVIRNRKGKL